MSTWSRPQITSCTLAFTAGYVDTSVSQLDPEDKLEDLGYDTAVSGQLASRLNDYLELPAKKFTSIWIRKDGRTVRQVVASAIRRRLGDELKDAAIDALIDSAKSGL